MKPYLIPILTLILSSCGSDQSSTSPESPPTSSAKPTSADEARLATGKCSLSHLASVGDWQVAPYDLDTVNVSSDCVFQSYYCESIGHIDSDLGTSDYGIAKITIVYEGKHNSGCLGTGQFQCQYNSSGGFTHQLYLSCQ